MPAFSARVADGRGRLQRLQVEATSEKAARTKLVADGLYPISVTEPDAGHGLRLRGPGRSKGAETAAARQLASLLEAGLPIDQALTIAIGADGSHGMGAALTRVREMVRAGGNLATALAQDPAVFPPVGIGMIAAGERSGDLGPAFGRLANYLESREEQRRRLLLALSYPCVMAVAGIAATAVLVVFVLPRFSDMLAAAGVPLPATTAFLLAAADLAASWWPAIVGGTGAVVLAATMGLRQDRMRLRWHEFLLDLPVIGGWRRAVAAVHVGQALSSLLRAGVPILGALDAAEEAVPDLATRARLGAVGDEVRAGSSLSAAIRDSTVFPPGFTEMVRIGERSGCLPDLMHRAAVIEERRLDRLAQRLVRYAEPAMIVLFGGLIGFVALALLQAVYGIHAGFAP